MAQTHTREPISRCTIPSLPALMYYLMSFVIFLKLLLQKGHYSQLSLWGASSECTFAAQMKNEILINHRVERTLEITKLSPFVFREEVTPIKGGMT